MSSSSVSFPSLSNCSCELGMFTRAKPRVALGWQVVVLLTLAVMVAPTTLAWSASRPSDFHPPLPLPLLTGLWRWRCDLSTRPL